MSSPTISGLPWSLIKANFSYRFNLFMAWRPFPRYSSITIVPGPTQSSDAVTVRQPLSVVEKATTELMEGERADVSWIQTESVDRQSEIVLTAGFNDDSFKGNPIVTINHDYTRSPVGR